MALLYIQIYIYYIYMAMSLTGKPFPVATQCVKTEC